MKKNIIIYIAAVVATLVIIASILCVIILKNKSEYDTKTIVITKYEEDNKVKTLEITNKKTIKTLVKICDEMQFNQDDTAKKLSVGDDIKIDMQNGTVFYLQQGLEEYCYIETTNQKSVILMPEGLYSFAIENSPKE